MIVPRWYQDKGIGFGSTRDDFGLFFEMRMGKTFTTVRTLKSPVPSTGKETGPVLVLTPLNAFDEWAETVIDEGEEFFDFRSASKEERDRVLVRQFDKHPTRRRYYLCNYQGLAAFPFLADLPWGAVVLDESTHIANPKAAITKICLKRFGYADRRVILSGLPSPEDALQLWPQLCFLRGEFMGYSNFWEWREEHCTALGYGWKIKPKSYRLMTDAIAEFAFTMTRKEAGYEVLKERSSTSVPMNDRQRKAYADIVDSWSHSKWDTQFATEKTLWLRRVAGGFSPDGSDVWSDDKAQETLSQVRRAVDVQDRSVVVWFAFRNELKLCSKLLDRAGVEHGIIHGNVKRDVRQWTRSAFRDGEIKAVLSMVDCAKYGANYSRGDLAVYYSNSYSNQTRLQSEDRILDLESPRIHEYRDIVSEDSLDVDVSESLMLKSFKSRSVRAALMARSRKHYV